MTYSLLYGLQLTPKSLSNIARAVGPSKLDQAPSPERFILRESLAHVLDWEPRFRSRLELAVEHCGSKIEEYDETALPTLGRYSEADAEACHDRFATERDATIAYAKSLTPEQSARYVQHFKHGQLSCIDILWMLLMHDAYHIEHAASLL
jgi:hypothetical protein